MNLNLGKSKLSAGLVVLTTAFMILAMASSAAAADDGSVGPLPDEVAGPFEITVVDDDLEDSGPIARTISDSEYSSGPKTVTKSLPAGETSYTTEQPVDSNGGTTEIKQNTIGEEDISYDDSSDDLDSPAITGVSRHDNGTVTISFDGALEGDEIVTYDAVETAELTETDDDGATDSDTATVTVNDVSEEGFPWVIVGIIIIAVIVILSAVLWLWQTGQLASERSCGGGI